MVEELLAGTGFTMLVDETGLLTGKTRNETACRIWACAHGEAPEDVQIVGDVLYGPTEEIFQEG